MLGEQVILIKQTVFSNAQVASKALTIFKAGKLSPHEKHAFVSRLASHLCKTSQKTGKVISLSRQEGPGLWA